jgi:hypothetical protein
MDNATIILQTLDSHLDHELSLVLYGRAALNLGFDNAPPATAHSKDVDCIIPLSRLEDLRHDLQFWDAQEATNDQLRPRGLYITHLFRADEVFLRASWERDIVAIRRLKLKWLRLSRPCALDLVLSKMMRGDDAQDMADAKFLIEQDRITKTQLNEAFPQMQPFQFPELEDAFKRAKPVVLQMAFD